MKDLYHEYQHQTIFINHEGTITMSTDALFSTIQIEQKSILDEFPFIASIFESLLSQPIGHIFQFKKVKTIHSFLPGIYDYTFTKTPICSNCKGNLIWTIFDKTIVYQKDLKEQQYRQEKIIRLPNRKNGNYFS